MEEKYRPLSPWAYFGYSLLFGIPLIGLIFLLIFSFNSRNINRRNFARSFFCSALFWILFIVASLIVAIFVFDFDYTVLLNYLK